MEVWKTITGFPDYQISNYGNVRKIMTTKPVAILVSKRGYPFFKLTNCFGKEIFYNLHQLVGKYFVPKPKDLINPSLDHLNMNKLDCCAFNLKWVEKQENERRAREINKINSRQNLQNHSTDKSNGQGKSENKS